MKRQLTSLSPLPSPVSAGGFTLVEMLVVIAIIGILAGLAVPAVMVALRKAKVAAVSFEINQLDAACKAYKEKLGEYPPDFAGLDNQITDKTTGMTYQVQAQNLILRHLAKAFPRYPNSSSWSAFATDVQTNWGINVNNLSPASALTFFLGGQPQWFTGA